MKKYTKHLLVVGSARSGTSWLAELIAQQHRYRLLFEPEHEFNTVKGKLLCDKYLTGETISRAAKNYIHQICANRVDSDWIAQCSNRTFKRHLWPFIPKKYIIKMVRGNLGANYMSAHFQLPTIKIVRNPYEVLHSQQRVKFPWLFDLTHFKNQPQLKDFLHDQYNFSFNELSTYTNLEKLAIRWSIENSILFQQAAPVEVPQELVKHEELRNNIGLFYELCEKFQLTPLANLSKVYKQPSSKTHPKSKIIQRQSNGYRFTKEEYACINAILDQFQNSLYPRES